MVVKRKFRAVARAKITRAKVHAVDFGADVWRALLDVVSSPGVVISILIIAVAIASHADNTVDSAISALLNYFSRIFPTVKTYCDYVIKNEHMLNGMMVFIPLLFGSPNGRGIPAYLVGCLWVFLSSKQSLLMYYAQCAVVLVIQRMPRRSAGVVTLIAAVALSGVYFGHFHGIK